MPTLELKIPPPVVAVVIAAAMWILSSPTPALTVPTAARVGIAVLIALTGGTFSLVGVLEFRRAKTTVNPMKPDKASALVVSGIYRITRNPMYMGLLLVLVGWAAFLAAMWPFFGPVVFFVYMGRFQIAPEERAMSAKFGSAYAAYKVRVRRWL